MSPTVSPGFKSYVAETLRMRAATEEAHQHHAEAERLRKDAERLEPQTKRELADVH